MKLNELKKQIPYKWKVQTVSDKKPKAQCVAYIDARDVMDLLDEVVGAENWSDEYVFVGNQWLCGLTIRTENGNLVTKWDTGVSGNYETEKSVISDSFKRAAVKWGIGRFLYDLEVQWVNTNKPGKGAYPVSTDGNRVWDLTGFIQSGDNKKSHIIKTVDKRVEKYSAHMCDYHKVEMTKKRSAKSGKEFYSHVDKEMGHCFGKGYKDEIQAHQDKLAAERVANDAAKVL